MDSRSGPSRRGDAKPHRMTREVAYNKHKAKARADAQAKVKRAAAANTDDPSQIRKSYSTPATNGRTSRQLEKTRAINDDPHPFRYKSFNDRLNAVHLSSSFTALSGGRGNTLAGLDVQGVAPWVNDQPKDDDAEDDDDDVDEETRMARLQSRTAFGSALQTWQELNLSVPFQQLIRSIWRQSQSLTMLLHHRDAIAGRLADTLASRSASDSWLAYEPCLDLFPRLALDLHQEFLPVYPLALDAMLRSTMITKNITGGDEQAAARIVEKGFEAIAALFRNIAPLVAKDKSWMSKTWEIVRPYMGWIGSDREQDTSNDDNKDADDDEQHPSASATPRSRNRHIPPHVRRFASEAFAHLLRRCKSSQLSYSAQDMLADAQAMLEGSHTDVSSPQAHSFATAVAGIWSQLIKGVDKRLHSQCEAHLSALLVQNDTHTAQACTLVGNLLITSLVHHGHSVHLVPLYEVLIKWSSERKASDERVNDLDPLVQSIRWLTTAVATRKGNRVADDIKGPLFTLVLDLLQDTQTITASPAIASATVQLVAFTMPIGRIPDLVGPGIKIVNALPTTQAIFATVVTALAQLPNWTSNFKQFVLPRVLEASATAIQGEDDDKANEAFSLLSNLVELGHISQLVNDQIQSQTPTVARWKRVVGAALIQRVQRLEQTLSHQETLKDVEPAQLCVLPLVPLFASAGKVTSELAASLRKSITMSAEKHLRCDTSQPLNPPMLLALLSSALDGLIQAVPSNKDRSSIQRSLFAELCEKHHLGTIAVEHLSQHQPALGAILQLFRTVSSIEGALISTPTVPELAANLHAGIMSEDDELRRVSVGWLELCGRTDSATSQLYAAMSAIESIPLAVDTVRDRNVRVRSLARDLLRVIGTADNGNSSSVTKAAQLVTRYILATLKLNFKPVWEESRKALADLVAASSATTFKFGDELWQVAFEELTRETQAKALPSEWSALLANVNAPSEDIDFDDQTHESFKDPQRTRRSQEIQQEWVQLSTRPLSTRVNTRFVQEQQLRGRLDVANYRAQILLLFSEQPAIVEKHNAQFVQHFFEKVVEDDVRLSAVVEEHEEDEDRDEDGAKDASARPALTVKQRQERLCTYLQVFNKFSNPKALFRSSELHDFLYTLIASGESRLQRLGLECICTWKDASQLPYSEKLFALLDQGKFREELASLNLTADESESSIQPHDRAAVMPLLLRVLFGLAISRKGRNSAATSGAGRKVAILNALSGCGQEELAVWVSLMLAPLQDLVGSASSSSIISAHPPKAFAAQQVGFLAFLAEVVKHLGQQVLPFWPDLISVTINLAHHASLRAVTQGPGKASAISRDIRQNSIRRLADFFRCPSSSSEQDPHFDWSPYIPVIFSALITPRLASFASENTQSPSALLDLFVVWSTRKETLKLFVQLDDGVLDALYACLAVPSVKSAVASPILDIVDRIVTAAEEERSEDAMEQDGAHLSIAATVLQPHIPSLIVNLAPALQRASSTNPPDPLLQREIQLLARLSVFITRSEDATTVLSLLGPMMRKSNRIVPEKSKSDLLATFRDLLLLTDTFRDPNSELFARYYELFASMWSTLRSRSARTNLGGVFKQIAQVDESGLKRVAEWVEKLNAYSAKRLDEVDFDTRLEVFDLLSTEADDEIQLSLREWQPIVHNMLFFIQDTEELVLRTNATAVLKRFVLAVKADADLSELFNRAVYPSLRRMLKSRFEVVRKEVISVIGFAVRHLSTADAEGDTTTSTPSSLSLSEMTGLLASGDEEANFFNNIHHIQLHRRSRALRRLADHAETGAMRSKTLSEVMLPLVGHFIEDGHTEIGDHNLTNETVTCIGRLARQLAWGSYNALLWKYLRLADGKGKGEKIFVRVAMAVLDNFHFAMEEEVHESDEQEQEPEQEDHEEAGGDVPPATAAAQPPPTARIVSSVTTKLLPALMGYLEHHDDDTDDAIRLPIAVGVVRVVECLPAAEKEVQLTKLLNVLSNVFRSKSQETRDLARETLCKIAVALGPERLPQIVKEMRRSLTRGPQLAVLAYNVHAVLVHLMTTPSGDGDSAPLGYLEDAAGIDDIVQVASEDIFGHTAEDREAIEYKTKQREMKQSKSLDTFEQLAKIIAPHRINSVILPLRNVMSETETPRAMKAVEDTLRRIASGINANDHFDHSALLGLCHSLISRNAAFLKPRKGAAKGKHADRGSKSLVNDDVLMKRKDVEARSAASSKKDHYATNAYRFVAFGLDLLVTALRRSRFDFASADVLSRLDPLVNAVGNTLYSADSHVLNLGLRAAGGLLRCPLPSLSEALPIFVRQTTQIINREANASSDASQAGLRTLSIMLRDCPQAEFKEKHLADLLTLCLPEIEEPQAQSTIFGLIRAILSRRFVLPEVYDVMDKIAEMLVTNQSASVRESCRAIFLQFLLDYPQGKGRLRNQMEFLAKNLSYVFESGRMSVMELLGAILAKFSDDVLQEYSELLFVALVMVLANDDQTKCREKAADLGKALLGLVDDERRTKLIGMTHSWASNADKPELARVGLQVYGLLVDSQPQSGDDDASGESNEWTQVAMKNARRVISLCADRLERAEAAAEDEEDPSSAFGIMDLDVDLEKEWQLPYHALQAITKLLKHNPPLMVSRGSNEMWTCIRRLLLFPHAWVRVAACRLLGVLFASVQPPAVQSGGGGDGPLELAALVDTVKKLSLQFKGNEREVDEGLNLQIVKNLLWIGKAFAGVRVDKQSQPEGDDDDEEEDGEAQDDPRGDGTRNTNALENPLAWMFTKLSYQSRTLSSNTTMASSSNPSGTSTSTPTSILRLFAALSNHLAPTQLTKFLPHIITPIYRLTSTETLHGSDIEALKSLAGEVQELVSEKVGSNAYAAVYARVRQRALDKRNERKKRESARKFGGNQGGDGDDGDNDGQRGEEAERKRARKNEAKHASRKRKNAAFAKEKVRSRPMKRHRGAA